MSIKYRYSQQQYGFHSTDRLPNDPQWRAQNKVYETNDMTIVWPAAGMIEQLNEGTFIYGTYVHLISLKINVKPRTFTGKISSDLVKNSLAKGLITQHYFQSKI